MNKDTIKIDTAKSKLDEIEEVEKKESDFKKSLMMNVNQTVV